MSHLKVNLRNVRSPEVWQIPVGTPCIKIVRYILCLC